MNAQIVMTGYVSDDELIWLYRNCYANLYPSLFEGFGLPVLEGMQFGAPTLASLSTSIPEVAGDAAILLAPEDTEGWAQAMLQLAANRLERARLRDAAKMQAARSSWEGQRESAVETVRGGCSITEENRAGASALPERNDHEFHQKG